MRAWILLILLNACTQSGSDDRVSASGGTKNNVMAGGQTSTPGDPNAALATFLPVTYTGELQTYLDRLCTASCHKGAPAPGSLLLTTAAGVKDSIAAMTAAIDAGTMPANAGNLSTADKKYLAQLNLSLKNWNKTAFTVDISDLRPTFANSIGTLTTGLCGKCHQGAQPSGGLLLQTADQWKTAMPRILQKVGSGSMPPKIDEVQQARLIRFLTEWQNQGFP